VQDPVRLGWEDPPTPDALEAALERLAASTGAGVLPARVEVDLDAPGSRALRWVLHRHGFRLEGVARQARVTASGLVDVLRYARLLDDPTEPREMFTAVMNSVTPRKRLIAHMLVTDAAGRVLLCETSFKPDFELPGGIVEPHESPRAGLLRELVEEIGTSLPVGGLLVADWLPPYLGWDDALELVFDTDVLADADAASLVPDGVEIVALHWVAEPDLADVMTPGGAARTRTAIRARAEPQTLYIEGGHEV
jgi:8-oxo-dGTP diphosphatase